MTYLSEEDHYAKMNDLSRQEFLNLDELKALYRILEHQYINYEDQEASTVVSKIGNILREHELANGPSKSTPGV